MRNRILLALFFTFAVNPAFGQIISRTPILDEGPAPQSGIAIPEAFFNGRILSVDPNLPVRLQHALDSTYERTSDPGRHGIAASVIMPGLSQWEGAVGTSGTDDMDTSMLFEIASNTKTFMTALIMQLQDSGKLSIDDKISKYLPRINNVDTAITIRQLLAHSSGVYDYLNDDPAATAIIRAYDQEPSRPWPVQEILDLIGKPNFNPGKGYKYSNTGFILLGLIADSVLHSDPGVEIRRRFIEPLGLTHTFIGWEDSIVGRFADNWITDGSPNPGQNIGYLNKTAQLSMASTAGGIVSTPGDLARWAHALYEGKVVSKAALTQMEKMNRWSDGSNYGLGTGLVPYGIHSFYGHGGHLLGFRSDMFDNPKDSIAVVIYMNSDAAPDDVQINDYALAILGEVYRPVSDVIASRSSNMQLWVSTATNGIRINYTLPKDKRASIALYDVVGRKIADIEDGPMSAGYHSNTTKLTGACFVRIVTDEGSKVVGARP